MVLQKRKADGSFEDWHSRTSMPTSTSNKRARTTISDASSYPTTHSHCLAPPAPAPSTARAGPSASTSYYSTAASSSSKKTAEKATKGKGKAKEKPVKEKRKAQFKSKCPQATQTRLDRYISQAQRIYLIHRRRTEGENREEFTVQGSTGNVYTVTIDEVPHCDCPDHQKGNHCKHILFIFLKVLQVSRDSGLWYQKALLPSELESIFSSAPLAPQLRQQLQNIHADERVVGAWREKTGRGPAPAPEGSTSTDTSTSAKDSRRIPDPEDDCPICYDKMNESGTGVGLAGDNEKAEELKKAYTELSKVLDWCAACGNAVHKECWSTWKTTTTRQGKPLTCVWCRANWVTSFSSSGSSSRIAWRADSAGPYPYASEGDEGYINLAHVPGSGASPARDTSTYYHGPRRGQRHYGDWDYL